MCVVRRIFGRRTKRRRECASGDAGLLQGCVDKAAVGVELRSCAGVYSFALTPAVQSNARGWMSDFRPVWGKVWCDGRECELGGKKSEDGVKAVPDSADWVSSRMLAVSQDVLDI